MYYVYIVVKIEPTSIQLQRRLQRSIQPAIFVFTFNFFSLFSCPHAYPVHAPSGAL